MPICRLTRRCFLGAAALVGAAASCACRAPSLHVADPVRIATPSLPRGTVTGFYGQVLQSMGGNAPIVWQITAGALPPGLTLESTTGIVKGSPNSLGAFTFTVQATDQSDMPGPSTDSQIFTINVGNAALATSAFRDTEPAVVYNENTNQWLVVYQQETSAIDFDLFGVLVDAAGERLPGPGIAIAAAPGVMERRPRVAYSVTSHTYCVVYQSDAHVARVILDDKGAVLDAAATIDASPATAREPVVVWNSQQGDFVVFWAADRDGNFDLFSEAVPPRGPLTQPAVVLRNMMGADILTPAAVYDVNRNVIFVVYETGGDLFAVITNGAARDMLGGVITVQNAPGRQSRPDVAFNDHRDEYLVMYQDDKGTTGEDDVLAIRFSADGRPRTGALPVDTEPGVQASPRVAYNWHTDSYFCVWERQTESGDFDIIGRALAHNGSPFDLNRISDPTADPTTETVDEFSPAIALNTTTHENFIAWQDTRSGIVDIEGTRWRDFGMIVRNYGAWQVDDNNNIHVIVDLFDFRVSISDIEVLLNQVACPFPQFGKLVRTEPDHAVLEFSIPAGELLGRVPRVQARVKTLPGRRK